MSHQRTWTDMGPTARDATSLRRSATLALLLAAGCAGIAQKPGGDAGAAGAGGAVSHDAGVDVGAATDAPVDAPAARDADPPRCGDGRLDPGIGEACDDGNTRSGDGCSGSCAAIEKDFDCPRPGTA